MCARMQTPAIASKLLMSIPYQWKKPVEHIELQSSVRYQNADKSGKLTGLCAEVPVLHFPNLSKLAQWYLIFLGHETHQIVSTISTDGYNHLREYCNLRPTSSWKRRPFLLASWDTSPTNLRWPRPSKEEGDWPLFAVVYTDNRPNHRQSSCTCRTDIMFSVEFPQKGETLKKAVNRGQTSRSFVFGGCWRRLSPGQQLVVHPAPVR